MQQATILIVDDNQLNIELSCDLLELEGFTIITASSGAESITKARQTIPDLILMDFRMPGMSGLETLQQLRKIPTTRHIPIITLTASVMVGEKERLLGEGFDGFMQKPINPTTFAQEVAGFLRTADTTNHE